MRFIAFKLITNNIRENFLKKFCIRGRHYWRNMENDLLRPPASVRGMTKLDREAFRKTINVPKLKIPNEKLNSIRSEIKKILLKIDKLKPIRDPNEGKGEKEILLHPLAIVGYESLPSGLIELGINESNFMFGPLELTYDNWNSEEILKSVLPEDKESLTSFSKIGHIVHVNLRDHLVPYKGLIGEVLLEKVAGCKCVVNKSQIIDNTFRNLELELLSGVPEYEVEVKENGVPFQLDFSKVYWNPRLATEHERIVNMLHESDVLYDVFAGIGPFSIPAAVKKKCTVLANDLNPDSYKWLKKSIAKNKKAKNIKTFNKDGKDFILEDVKADLSERWARNDVKDYNIHITMNLPSLATEFLIYFKGLLADSNDSWQSEHKVFPLVHVYTFAKGEDSKNVARQNVENKLGTLSSIKEIRFVRNVAPNKDMFRVSFYLTDDILLDKSSKRSSSPEDRMLKKACIR